MDRQNRSSRGAPVKAVAEAISPRLADAAVTAYVDDKMVDLTYPLTAGREGPDRDQQESGSPRGVSALHGPPDGRGGDGALPERAVRHRPAHRRRLLLRLHRRTSLRARRSRGDREEDEGARAGRFRLRAPDVAAAGGDRLLHQARRAAQGAADRGEDGGTARGVGLHDQGQGHVRRLLRRPARAVNGSAQGVQADGDVERVLEGRREERADAARVRHGVLLAEGARRAPDASRGSEEARSPQGRQRSRPVHVPSVGAGRGLLDGQGRDALQHARRLHARQAVPGRLPGSEDADRLQQGAVGHVGPLVALPREHVPGEVGGRRRDGPEGDELPGPLPALLDARSTATRKCRSASTSRRRCIATRRRACSPG